MRLILRQRWRLYALNSCLGIMDIKTGAIIVVLFALLNKVAGLYGLIAIFNGGTLAQLSMYIYSVLALAAFTWGMNAITEENPKKSFYFAHIFLGDHLLNTIWTVFFAISWWYYNPHDGKRVANSDAQKEMMGSGGPVMTDEERAAAAQLIWNKEKGTAAMVLFIGWALKLYFAALLYSYALHLRRGSYRSLANSSLDTTDSIRSAHAAHDEYEGLDDNDEFYQMPLRNSIPYGSGLNFPGSPGPSSRARRTNGTASPLPRSSSRIMRDLEAPMEPVLWDEEEEEVVEASGRLPIMSKIPARTEMDLASEDGDDLDGDVERAAGLKAPKPRLTRAITS